MATGMLSFVCAITGDGPVDKSSWLGLKSRKFLLEFRDITAKNAA